MHGNGMSSAHNSRNTIADGDSRNTGRAKASGNAGRFNSLPSQIEVKPKGDLSFDSAVPIQGRESNVSSTTAQSSERRSTFFNRITTMIVMEDMKFEDERWLLMPLGGCLTVAVLSALLVLCQALEAKPQGIIMRDSELADSIVWNPETYMPCFDQWENHCWPQYLASFFFGLVGILALLESYFVYHSWTVFRNEGRERSWGTGTTMGLGGRSWGTTMKGMVSKFTPVGTNFEPGAKWFWYRAWASFLTEIVLQTARGFFLGDSYATISSAQTMAQVGLIVFQTDLFLYYYYKRSEVGYVFCGFYFEMLYLVVRVSIYGPLSLRTNGVIDFATIAVPLLITISDMHEILHFITHGIQPKPEVKYSADNKYGNILAGVAFLVTGAGILLCAGIIKIAYLEDCPRVYDVEVRPDDFLVPEGLDCYSWQFNLYLYPACMCLYLAVNPHQTATCAGLGDNGHEVLDRVLPHLADVRFMHVGVSLSANCRVNENDLQLLSSFRHLQRLSMYELHVDALPDSFANLEDMREFDLRWSRLKHINANAIKTWTKLESFYCLHCPHLDNLDALADTPLPRLEIAQVHGVEVCPMETLNKHADFQCTEMNSTETCPGMPSWLFNSLVSGASDARGRHKCVQAICLPIWTRWQFNDPNLDYLVEMTEGVTGLGFFLAGVEAQQGLDQTYSESTHECFVAALREAVGYIEPGGYDGIDVSQFHTHPEYMAMITQYSTCLECPFTEEAFEQRQIKWAAKENIDMSDPCWMITTHALNTISDFGEACRNPVTECSANSCPLGFQYILPADMNSDGILETEEMARLGEIAAAKWTVPGIFECLQQQAPDCVDAEVDGKPALSTGNIMRLGFLEFGLPITSCSECPEFPSP